MNIKFFKFTVLSATLFLAACAQISTHSRANSSDEGKEFFEYIGVEFSDLLERPRSLVNKTFALTSYVLIADGEVKLLPNLAALNQPDIAGGGVDVDPADTSAFEGFNGCLVITTATLKPLPRNSNVYRVSQVRRVTHNGLMYYIAGDIMKRNNVPGKPKCMGEALLELMTRP